MRITDGFTSYRHVFLLRTKDEAFSHFQTYTRTVETFHSRKIKKLVSDGGGEYVNQPFSNWLSSRGISHQVTAPYTPEQNAVSERGNTITVERARCLRLTAGMPSNLWGEAVNTAIYLENRLPSKSVGFTTPYELWHGRHSLYDHIRTFGCAAFLHLPKHKRDGKFGPTAQRCVLLGFCEGTRNYWVVEPVSMKVSVSHNVSFDESSFPFASLHHDAGLQSLSELFEDESAPLIGPANPSQSLTFDVGPPTASSPPSESQVPPADPSLSNTTRPIRNRQAPERYGQFGALAFNAEVAPPGEPLT